MTPPFAGRADLDRSARFDIPPIEAFREKDIVNFTRGYTSPSELPDDELSDAWDEVMANHRDVALQYGPSRGLATLRETIRDYLTTDYEIDVPMDHLSIVTGAKQGLDLLCKTLLEPGDRVIVTAPTYGTGLKILKSHEADLLEVPVDDDGMVVSELTEDLERLAQADEPMPKLAFTVPEFHNPVGSTMDPARRELLLSLAQEYDFVIAEDDPYRKLRFEGDEVPPIKSLDGSGHVVYLGTYSKLIAPGLRVGWMVGDPDLIDHTIPMKADGGTSALCQMLVHNLHEQGIVTERAGRYATYLRGQRDATLAALEAHLPDAEIAHVPAGGYYCWVELPGGVNTSELLEYAREEDVLYLPGQTFNPSGGNRNFLRISWAYETPERIDEGMARLAEALERYRTTGA